jgi:hypothetical protein
MINHQNEIGEGIFEAGSAAYMKMKDAKMGA